jgi:hypothetical protein
MLGTIFASGPHFSSEKMRVPSRAVHVYICASAPSPICNAPSARSTRQKNRILTSGSLQCGVDATQARERQEAGALARAILPTTRLLDARRGR